MKKIIAILAASAMVLFALAGCSSSAAANTNPVSASVSPKENASSTTASNLDYTEESGANGEIQAQFYGVSFVYSLDLGINKDTPNQILTFHKSGIKNESIELQYMPTDSLDDINTKYQSLYTSMKDKFNDFYPNFSPTYSPSKMGLLFSYNYTDYSKHKIKADCEIFTTIKGGVVWITYNHTERKALSGYYKGILDSLDKGAYEVLTGDKSPSTVSSDASGMDNVSSSASSQAETSSTPESLIMDLDNFQKIQTGMSYKQVAALVGEGTIMSQSEYDGTKTIIYEWYGSGSTGANANAMFQNDKLVSKSQFGLS